jgi:hypothetical protein
MALVYMNLRENVEKKKQCELSSPALSQRQPPQRSRSIKIPGEDQRRDLVEDYDTAQLQEHYNSATMRMYYRITDYRNRNALPASNGHNNRATTNPPVSTYSAHANRVTPVDEEELAMTSYPLEESDAIFEMDL